MSYQVIARKYRPRRFSDVVGQEHVSQTLANAIQQGRVAHAYLFVGPRGTGKTTIARIFAKCLNCTGGPKVDFDDADPRCIEIAEGRSLDVIEIDGASNRGIEEIRDLRETVKYAPASSSFKIYIIDEVHMLTKEAFNALLKTLEEPPAHVKFMFATTEPEKVLPTILSRCQRFDLRRIPANLIVRHLAHIASLEKIKVEGAALQAIARGADGGMRDAESTLDQLISFCDGEILERDVLSMFGLTAPSRLLTLAEAILEGKSETALRELDSLAKLGKDLSRLLSDLLIHFRNLLVFQVTRGDISLLEVTESETAAIAQQSAGTNPDAVRRILEILTESEGRFRDAASKKIFLEVALLRAIQAREAVNLDAVLQQIHRLQTETAGKAPTGPRIETAAATLPLPVSATATPIRVTSEVAPVQSAPIAAPATETEFGPLWQTIIDAVGRVSPFVRSYLSEAHLVSFTNKVLTIGFDPEFADHLALVDNARNHAMLQTKLRELGFDHAQIKFIQAEAPIAHRQARQSAAAARAQVAVTDATSALVKDTAVAGKARPRMPTATTEEFKNDPLIQKALEVFKGQIVEILG